MASTESSWTPSRRLQSAAAAERERIERELARVEREHEALAAGLAVLREARDGLRDELAAVNRFIQEPSGAAEATPAGGNGAAANGQGETPPAVVAPNAPMGTVVKGAHIREVAVQVLAASPKAYGPIHYREWYELLRADGFVPAGKNPLATFLTQVGRSPVVRRTTEAGVYQLDTDFPEHARERLRDLQTQLRRSHELPMNADVQTITRAREARGELSAAADALERELEEALRSLGETSGERPLRVATG